MSESLLPDIEIARFNYELPEDRIAMQPAPERNSSKLLVYNNGVITDGVFSELGSFLPSYSTLLLNNTRVIPARLFFRNERNATIEVFLLSKDPQKTDTWHCLAGNKRKFKETDTLYIAIENDTLFCKWANREANTVSFFTRGNMSVEEALRKAGQIPLPPYIKRKAEKQDELSYQTVFGVNEGAVAAPTASLHFTNNQLAELQDMGVKLAQATLHVGMGTFLPVTANSSAGHKMHEERFSITKATLKELLKATFIVPCGTTAMRLLESLPFIGAKLLLKEMAPFYIGPEDGYNPRYNKVDKQTALKAIIEYLDRRGEESIAGSTAIFILPGFRFQFSDALITNFHQPGSTLLMLVEAFVGGNWKHIYQHALQNDYRFLSYGDSSLLIRQKNTASY